MASSGSDDVFDVCVVGGGPAGTTAATVLRMRQKRVALVEREALPVYKIGESLLPATIHGVCKIIGVSDEIHRAGFIRKLGGTFRWGLAREPWTFAFAESEAYEGPTSYAYQVERTRFDQILWNHAKAKGVLARDRTELVDLDEAGNGDKVVHLRGPEGETYSIVAKYVVDASGHSSRLARRVGRRIVSPDFQNIAIFGYFRGAGRLAPPRSGNIFCAAFEKGWFWYIPLSSELTSVGAVIGSEYADALRTSQESALGQLIEECEPIRELLRSAHRVTDGPYGAIRIRRDYSYCHTCFWKDRLVLVGDAACFIDPVFSSGVHLATYAGLLAGRSLNGILEETLDEESASAEFERRYRREFQYFYEFLQAFYNMEQDVDSYYWHAKRATNTDVSGKEAFLRLVGGGSDPHLMRRPSLAPEALFPAATGVAAASTPPYARGMTKEASAFWAALNAEGFGLMINGMARRSVGGAHTTLRETADGLSWQQPARSCSAR